MAGGNASRWKTINGVKHKLCSGPGHDEPTWLPATDKYYYRHGSDHAARPNALFSQCRLCVNWTKVKSPGLQGWVPASVARPFFLEAVRRVGIAEVARRMGVSDSTVALIVREKRQYVQKRTLRTLMLELISMRRKGEVWHRDTILHGSQLRGHTVKKPTERHDYYTSHGDDDNERRRKWNREHSEHTRAYDRERSKQRRVT